MPVDVISFQEALAQTENLRRHLLLGNGFSIALFPDCFRYDSLLESADESGLFDDMPEARRVFNELGTQDFEEVIDALRSTIRVIPFYTDETTLPDSMTAHAEALKEILVQAIAGRHPERPADINDEQYEACRDFLGNFVGDRRVLEIGGRDKDVRGNIYTLNYDLLLYWTLLHDDIIRWNDLTDMTTITFEEDDEELKHDDGFRVSDIDPDAPYVAWEAEGAANSQNIHYLHGAIHLFDDGPELQKYCWERSGGIPLIDQTRAALDRNLFPLFVSEGNTLGKLARIRHSGYLQRSLRSFAGVCRAPRGGSCLFVFGHSLADNDQHILKYLAKGSIPKVYISLYGDPDSDANRRIVASANRIIADRSDRYELEVIFYCAQSANVWGANE